MVVITPTFTAGFDTNFGANAVAAKAAWQAAADIFATQLVDNIHVNITVDGVAGTSVFGQSNMSLFTIVYTDLLARVTAQATTQDDNVAIGPGGSMTSADPPTVPGHGG